MAETPKKIECDNKCFLCNVFTPSSAERVKIFGRSVAECSRSSSPDQLSSPTVKISHLTEALEQICLYARIAKKRLRSSTQFFSP